MKHLVIVTGGTGGHIYPALALADAAKEKHPELQITFIGNDDRMEADLVPAAGYPFYAVHASGLEGSLAHKIGALFQTLSARSKAKQILKELQPDLVMGFGGYVSAPVMMAAQQLGIPTLLHEQNSVVGKSNKLVMGKTDAIAICYDKAREVFPPEKTVMTGNPRATLAAHAELDEAYWNDLHLDPDRRTILIMMGSLGSASVNELMKEALKGIDEGLQFIYACGKDNDSDLDLFDGQENIHVVPYIDSLRIYPKVDGMICRAGATTLCEVTALGIPAIIVPSPYVANNHQYYNARMLTDKGAARLIEEKDLNAATLRREIRQLFGNPHAMKETAAAARAMGRPEAAYELLALAEKTADRSRKHD